MQWMLSQHTTETVTSLYLLKHCTKKVAALWNHHWSCASKETESSDSFGHLVRVSIFPGPKLSSRSPFYTSPPLSPVQERVAASFQASQPYGLIIQVHFVVTFAYSWHRRSSPECLCHPAWFPVRHVSLLEFTFEPGSP